MNTKKHPTVLLVDIDGTLINSGGAGGAALLDALVAHFGVSNPVAVPLHGRTDAGIFRELLEENGIEATDANYQTLCERYFSMLPSVLASRRDAPLPGVRSLLTAFESHPVFAMALLTGNLPHSARLKLKHFDLDRFFAHGTFGDTARHRHDLAAPALSTARLLLDEAGYEGPLQPERVVVIGDTPLDISLAKLMGARCLAVATGGYDLVSLREAGADWAVDDLTATDEILQWCSA